ncbi:hypothetical protein NQ318_007673 [Aromia moschata]|uniref:Alkylglycerone-phosphate synthase n=1 Tax=Aromia moschata TaxID=1265417 RepID=A0AAV8XKQ4_9CUCU|nr:hypothetical protein NQ318_007673 [Aromia moschata]
MRKNAHKKCKLFKSYLNMIQIDEHELLKWNGWGYNDSKFVVKNGDVYFSELEDFIEPFVSVLGYIIPQDSNVRNLDPNDVGQVADVPFVREIRTGRHFMSACNVK